jgi:hypothetical protein
MSNNPYSAPPPIESAGRPSPQSQVSGPAISLQVVAWISIVGCSLGLVLDGLLLLNVLPHDENDQIAIRMTWGIILLVASILVVYAAGQMKRLRRYQVAFAGAIVAAIPCFGPCCLLGIPFGIWALVVLNRPDVRSAFVD